MPVIRVSALGLLWREGKLLATEVRDASGRLVGWRPPGGGIGFGERWQAALIREFREELGLEVEVAGLPLVLENIFTHDGQAGHEIVFAAELRLLGPMPEEAPMLQEDDGTQQVTGWFDPAELDREGGPRLYPDGLQPLLGRG